MTKSEIESVLRHIRAKKYGQTWTKWSACHKTIWHSQTMEIAG